MPEAPSMSLAALVAEAQKIWSSGGWAMWAIAVIALVMFGLGVHIWFRLRSRQFGMPERIWRDWIDDPSRRRGPVGRLLDAVDDHQTVEEAFAHLRTLEMGSFERDLKVMKIWVSAAPLVGLLGTVTGMLATFDALSLGGGGKQTMSMIAGGISEALITTETGLVVALPGLFLQYHLARGFERYRAFLAHLESVCAQRRFRKSQERRNRNRSTIRSFAEALASAA